MRVYRGPLAPAQPQQSAIPSFLTPWKSTPMTSGPPLTASQLLPPKKRPAEGRVDDVAKRPRLAAFPAPVLNPLKPSLAPPPSLGAILRMTADATAKAQAAQAEISAAASSALPTKAVEVEVVNPKALAPAKPSGIRGLLNSVARLLSVLSRATLPSSADEAPVAPAAPATTKEVPEPLVPMSSSPVEEVPLVQSDKNVPISIDEDSDAESPTIKPLNGKSLSIEKPKKLAIRVGNKATKDAPAPYRFSAPPSAPTEPQKKPAVSTKKTSASTASASKRKVPSAFPKNAPRPRANRLLDAEKKAGVVPMDLCAITTKESGLDAEAIDTKTGIRVCFLQILYPEKYDNKKMTPKPKAPVPSMLNNKPKGHRPDPNDRQFARPLILAEPVYKKRERKSILTRFLTDADCLKFDKFHITWDCTQCLRTFLDKESLAMHKPQCRYQRNPDGGPKAYACQFCKRGFPNESVLLSHKQHNHGDLKEVKEEVRTEELRLDVEKIQLWADKCTIQANQVENCMNTLHQLHEMLTTMKVYLASDVAATKQLAGREMMVMIDIAVKASALGCSTSAVSVADITNANPTVVAGLFHAIAHLEGFGLLPGALRRRVDDTRRKRNIVFHTLGVVLDEVALERQCALAVDVLRWAQVLMDRTLNVVNAPRWFRFYDDDECLAPRKDHVMEVEAGPRPYSPTLAMPASMDAPTVGDAKPGAVPAPTLPVGVANLGNQSGIPAWKYTAPAIPILNKPSILLGAPPTSSMVKK